MIILLFLSTLFKFALISTSVHLQINPDLPQIDNPRSGDILQGVITIFGSTDLTDYHHYQISFNYADSQADTWFLIAQSENMVGDGQLATWDTTTIADGNYKIRLEVFLNDGSSTEISVDGLRVRNYTPVETLSIPPQLIKGDGIAQTDTPFSITESPKTSHEIITNPITVSMEDFNKSLAGGAAFSFLLFLILMIYSAISRTLK